MLLCVYKIKTCVNSADVVAECTRFAVRVGSMSIYSKTSNENPNYSELISTDNAVDPEF